MRTASIKKMLPTQNHICPWESTLVKIKTKNPMSTQHCKHSHCPQNSSCTQNAAIMNNTITKHRKGSTYCFSNFILCWQYFSNVQNLKQVFFLQTSEDGNFTISLLYGTNNKGQQLNFEFANKVLKPVKHWFWRRLHLQKIKLFWTCMKNPLTRALRMLR